jgi:hypothetical protein
LKSNPVLIVGFEILRKLHAEKWQGHSYSTCRKELFTTSYGGIPDLEYIFLFLAAKSEIPKIKFPM